MEQTTVRLPEELRRAVDEARAEEAQETGEIRSRSEWMREAVREKLGVDYTNDDNDTPAEEVDA